MHFNFFKARELRSGFLNDGLIILATHNIDALQNIIPQSAEAFAFKINPISSFLPDIGHSIEVAAYIVLVEIYSPIYRVVYHRVLAD
jgi:Na+-transporting NADH:ubiquinone oxidoreductase subunit NqrD